MSQMDVPQSSTVYTPTDLAAAMVGAVRGTKSTRWLDPCIGDGAFVAQMAALGIPSEQIVAVDIARAAGGFDHAARTVRGVDFLAWARHNRASVDQVVMNPPYVALNRLTGELLDRALDVALCDGQRLPLQANYWAAFLLTAVECVKRGGSLAAVLPAAWDFAKYAAGVRETIARSFGEVFVIRCASPLFPKVQEGVVVVIAFDRGADTRVERRTEVPDLAATVAALHQIAQGCALIGASTVRALSPTSTASQRLADLVHIHIGAVTGDASYFLLSEEERQSWGLPISALRPALTRSKHLASAYIGISEWAKLRDSGARIWMFRPSKRDFKNHAVTAYLKHGENGGCNVAAHKIASRDPWHTTPLPRQVDGFVSGMSKRLPFLALREMPGLTASNTLYVVRFKKRATASEKATLGVLMLTSAVRKELARHARIYADGLLKFEPADLGAVRLPVVPTREDAVHVLNRATALLLAGHEEAASALADAWVERTTSSKTQDHLAPFEPAAA